MQNIIWFIQGAVQAAVPLVLAFAMIHLYFYQTKK